MSRIILHIDMDSFYSQIEEIENKELSGKPVVVCMFSARGGDSGAVAAANYIAREMGIKAGMPISRAKKIGPEAVFLPARREFYREISREVMNVLKGFSESFEQVSVDEAYLDISKKTDGDYSTAKKIALLLKKEIKEKKGLTCSVGIGPNKLISKMAANLEKPDGLTVILPENVEEFLTPLPVKKLFRVGPKIAESLKEMGIETIGDLSKVDQKTLIDTFGKVRGNWLYEASKGIDESPVEERGDPKQISRLKTLEENTRDKEVILAQLKELSDIVINELSRSNRHYRTINVIFILQNLKTRTKSRTLPHYHEDLDTVIKNIKELLNEFLNESHSKIRRIGVGVSDLQDVSGQKTLFEF